MPFTAILPKGPASKMAGGSHCTGLVTAGAGSGAGAAAVGEAAAAEASPVAVAEGAGEAAGALEDWAVWAWAAVRNDTNSKAYCKRFISRSPF
jgi:hypothetical protein